jgi:hypothetical protein
MRTASCLTLIAMGAIFTFAVSAAHPSFLNSRSQVHIGRRQLLRPCITDVMGADRDALAASAC